MMKIFRWIIFLPASLLSAFLVSALIGIITRAILPGWLQWVGWIINGAFFVSTYLVAGSTIAPKSNKLAKWSLIIILLIISITATAGGIIAKDKQGIIGGISMALFTSISVRARQDYRTTHDSLDKHDTNEAQDNIIDQLIFQNRNNILKYIDSEPKNNWIKHQYFILQLVWIAAIEKSYNKKINKTADGYKFILPLTEDDPTPPSILDPNNIIHYQYAQDVTFMYTDFLANNNQYNNCLIKPESILPLPKNHISVACQHFSSYLEQNAFESQATYSQGGLTIQQFITNLKTLSLELNSTRCQYLPLEQSEIPSDPTENKRFYMSYKKQQWKDQVSKS
jgi:hypothetical protein